MGLIRFLVHPPGSVDNQTAHHAYFAGPDMVPWPSRNRLTGNLLLVERPDNDSGAFYIPWAVSGRGRLMLATGTLMQRDRPYLLPVELARGTVHRVRLQLADWEAAGLQVSDELRMQLRQATDHLAQAVCRQQAPDAASKFAGQAIEVVLETADQLLRAYTRQAIAAQRRTHGRLTASLGVCLDRHDENVGTLPGELEAALGSVVVSLNWHACEAAEGNYCWETYDRQIEWAAAQGINIFGGPLLLLAPDGFPDWLCLWENDFANLRSVVTDYIETVINRYSGRIQHWICSAWSGQTEVLGLSEEERLHLVVRAIEIAERLDPDTPRMLCLYQPWAESLKFHQIEFSPLQIADAIIRSGLRVSSLGLRIDMGYVPTGSWPRHALELSRLVDLWSCFGLPLYLIVSCPSRPAVDSETASSGELKIEGSWSPQEQARWARRVMSMLLAKPLVHGVLWGQLRDTAALFPYAGLLDEQGNAKPTVEAIARLHRKYLG